MSRFSLSFPGRASVWAALRLTTAALAALGISALLQLDSPYWAAMTVLIVAQPTRDQLLGKSLARLAGTAVGALAAVLLLHLSEVSALGFVICLAFWVGGCALLANLLSGFNTYAALLAGYSAALVALFGLQQHQSLDLMAWTRLGTVLVGVLVSMLVSWLWIPPQKLGLRLRLKQVRDDLQRMVQASLTEGASPVLDAEGQRLLQELAEIDALCNQGSSGRRERRQSRRLVLALTDLLSASRQLTVRLAQGAGAPAAETGLSAHLAELVRQPALQSEALQRRLVYLQEALVGVEIEWQRLEASPGREPAYSTAAVSDLRNWPDALRAGFRLTSVLLVCGIGWVLSGWSMLVMAMLGVAVLGSIFSTLPAPRTLILRAVLGTTLGSLAAAAYVLWIEPALPGLSLRILALVPFLLFGSLLLWQRKTAIVGTDFSMVFLLLSAPGMPIPDPGYFLQIAPGPLLGALLATAAFYLLLPTGPRQRCADLQRMQFGDLRRLMTSQALPPEVLWRARLHQRTLKLVQCAPLSGLALPQLHREQAQILHLGAELYALRQGLQSSGGGIIERIAGTLEGLSQQPAQLQISAQALQLLLPSLAARPELQAQLRQVQQQLRALAGVLTPQAASQPAIQGVIEPPGNSKE